MNKKYLVICNAYPKEYDDLYISLSGCDTTLSSVIYSNSVIRGFYENKLDYVTISAASVGHYPFTTKTKMLPSIQYGDSFYGVGYRNTLLRSQRSKAKAIWKEYKKHFSGNEELNILVTDVHTPFLKAARKIQRHNKQAKVVLVCLDLPQFVKSNSTNPVLKLLKKISIRQVSRLSKKVDGYVFLSNYMQESFGKNEKPSIVSPCILDSTIYDGCSKHEHQTIDFVYCGVLSKQYGLDFLLESFQLLKNPTYRLLLAGKGDAVDDIKAFSARDSRIQWLGEISRDKACQIQFDADVLVNPRLPNTDFVKMSFPSKTISFLFSGNPLCCYELPSFPDDIREVINSPKDISHESLAVAMEKSIGKINKKQVMISRKYDEKTVVNSFVRLFERVRNNE